jgi:hypothetical protein
MKKLIIPTIALFLMMVLALCVAFGQTTEFEIEKYFDRVLIDTADVAPPFDSVTIDSLFVYSFSLLTISDNERDTIVEKRGRLSLSAVQALVFNNIRSTYNRIANLERQIDRAFIERNANLRAADEAGVGDYFQFERDRIWRNINGTWVVRFNGVTYKCFIAGNGRLRIADNDTNGIPPNTLVGVIIPRSHKYFVINLDAAFEVNIGENIELFSSDADTFWGEDSSGNRIVLRFTQQTN